MKSIYLVLAIISFNINSIAQTMTVEGYKFKLDNVEYSPKEILPFMKNTNAYINAVNAKSKRHDSFILAGIAAATTGIVTAKVLKENTYSFYFTPLIRH